jgi:hypothetical protein
VILRIAVGLALCPCAVATACPYCIVVPGDVIKAK